MKRISIASLFVILLMSSFLGTAQDATAVQAVDAFLQEQFEANGFPGMSAAVVRDGEVIYSRAFGEGITPETPFYAGSLAKSVTAAAVLTLVDAGEINLDAPITTYLLDFTVSGDYTAEDITVRMLLNQRSGFSDASYNGMAKAQGTSLDAAVADLSGAMLTSEPGTVHSYFNPNYALLGLILEEVSGQSFEVYVQEHIFDPLEMTSATYVVSDQLPQGYNFLFGIPIARDNVVPVLNADGGLILTAEDMARFMMVFMNEGEPILSPVSAALAITPPDETTYYAMGWYENTFGDVNVIMHGGDISNFHSDAVMLVEDNTSIVIFYNSNNLLGAFMTFPSVIGGVVTRVAGAEPLPGGITIRALGIIILAFSVLSILNDILRILRLPKWAEKNRGRSIIGLLLDLALTLIPLYFLLLLPNLVLWFSGRAVTYELLIAYMPDLMLLLAISVPLALIQVAGKLLLLRPRPLPEPVPVAA